MLKYEKWHLQSPDGKLWGPDVRSTFQAQGSKLESNVNPVTTASAAGLNIFNQYNINKVSGALAMTLIRVPSGYRGRITLIPTGAFTGATGGTYASDGVNDDIPIGLAFTAVVGKALDLVIDGLLAYPSYVS